MSPDDPQPRNPEDRAGSWPSLMAAPKAELVNLSTQANVSGTGRPTRVSVSSCSENRLRAGRPLRSSNHEKCVILNGGRHDRSEGSVFKPYSVQADSRFFAPFVPHYTQNDRLLGRSLALPAYVRLQVLSPELLENERREDGCILDLLFEREAGRVAGLRVVMQQDGAVGTRGGL